ncbi:hypothetical protein [Nonomuraea sp. NPDC049750]|uniref:hypothetical protein n=1 Tax=Nonomuraea sp. NPDC049750 TaxID=3154738 RepID=UPI0033C9FAD9
MSTAETIRLVVGEKFRTVRSTATVATAETIRLVVGEEFRRVRVAAQVARAGRARDQE